MFRYFIELSYLGTNYHGWQVQPNSVTIQEKINQSLNTILRNKAIHVVGCGRTDTGVHASEFFAHFDFNILIEDLDKLTYKLNRILPFDIAIKKINLVDNDHHARFSASKRTYKYYVNLEKSPFHFNTSLLYPYELNIQKLNEAASMILKYSDFESFCKAHSDANNYLCTVSESKWEIKDHQLIYTVSANRFLRNMVRALVGTQLDVGRGYINIEDYKKIIESKKRTNAGKSIAAKGLFLHKIEYPFFKN
jgi:tRNA pseudouridine38-40 synthase